MAIPTLAVTSMVGDQLVSAIVVWNWLPTTMVIGRVGDPFEGFSHWHRYAGTTGETWRNDDSAYSPYIFLPPEIYLVTNCGKVCSLRCTNPSAFLGPEA